MKHELLSPAGDMESLYQAVFNGADAIYVGLKEFGARHFAKNFSNEEIIEAIKLCHLYGIKLYVTMNTLIKDNEVDSFLEQIEFLHKNGIDAVIMQDFGMICLVRKIYPNLEIHASTQTNSSSIETIKLFKSLGVKRIVLPREMNIDEINSINVDIEKEVFIHGALCICYSGNCLMSSMLGSRSGNRGECVGSCRLQYDLEQNNKIVSKGKYLLSTKEFNTSSKFKELLDSNIDSFKIEGRMKSPEYVGFITRFYRKLIDKENFDLDEETDKLKVLFNRDFTTGNLFSDKYLMNVNSPNHIGIEIGKVIEVNNKIIKIKLIREINQEDGIRFKESKKGLIVNYLYDLSSKLVNSTNDIVIIDNKVDLTTKDTVYKTIDKKLMEQLKKLPSRKINIKFFLTAKKGKKLRLEVNDSINNIEKEMKIVEEAKTSSITKERIEQQLFKLGNTPFNCANVSIDMDKDIFISIKELNELRRNVIEELISVRENKKNKYVKCKENFDKLNVKIDNGLTASVYNEEQLITCLELKFERIYVNDLDLYNKYKSNNEIYYKVERNRLYIEQQLQEKSQIGENILFSDYKNIYGDYFLNITNIYSAYYLLRNKLKVIPISVELSEEKINNLYMKFKEKFFIDLPLEILSYGRVCNMIIKNNILELDSYSNYRLKDQKNNYFPVYCKNDKTYILNKENRIIKYKFPFNYVKRFDFYNETRQEILNIVNKLK